MTAPKKVGKYTVLRGLGHGPRGESWLGEAPDGRRVAIKLVQGDEAQILEEARRVAALSHPHIAVSQVGLHENRPFVATEFQEGSSLAEWLKERHPPSDQLRIIAGVAGGLDYAHEQGLLHRAVTPTNVIVPSAGPCKLVDFAAAPGPSVRQSAAAAYLAPEVLQGAPLTAKSDIYSAGLLFYEVLSGRNPFARGTPAATAQAVLEDLPAPLRELRSDVSRDLTDAVMACLDKDADWRPKDLSFIRELAGGAGRASESETAAPAVEPAGAAPAQASFGGTKQQRMSGRLIAAGAGVVLLVGGAAWLWLRPTAPRTASRGGGEGAPPSAAPPESPPGSAPAAPATPEPTPPTAVKTLAVEVARPTPQASPGREAKAQAPTPAAPLAPAAAASPEPPRPSPTPPSQTPEPVAPPTPAPAERAAQPPSLPGAASLEPASLKNLTPPSVKRHATGILDLHGTGLRPDHQAVILRGRESAQGISVLRQRLMSAGLLQVVINVDDAAAPGAYSIALTDAQGRTTNALRFEVAR